MVTSALGEPLLSTLAAFRQARSRVDLQITEVDTPAGQQALLQHEIDVAVIRPSTPVRGLRIRPWRHDEFVIALPPGHPLAAGAPGPVHLARFAEEPWVWLRRDASPDYHDQLMATCRRAGFSPDIRHLANSIFTQLAMAASGLGVTLAPNVSVRQIQPAPRTAPHRPRQHRRTLPRIPGRTPGTADRTVPDHRCSVTISRGPITYFYYFDRKT